MLLWPDQYAQLTAPPVSRRQAIPLPNSSMVLGFGVIPYEIAPNFSELSDSGCSTP